MKIYLVLILMVSFIFAQEFKNYRVDTEAYQPNEVTISINPSNPNFIAAGSNLNYFYASDDGGKTWSEMKMTSGLGVWGDPVVLYDDKNNLYFSHLRGTGWSDPNFADRIIIQKSTNNGTIWSSEAYTTPSTPKFEDKEWMGVDLSKNSPHKNNLYIAWTEFDQYGVNFNDKKSRILFSYSEDKGNSWATSKKISDLEGNCEDGDLTTEGAVPTCGPNGEVYVSWSYNSKLYFDKSFDGGKNFGADVVVSNQPGGWNYSIPGIMRCNGMPITKCDVSNSDFRGRIYVNWSDQRNGSTDTDILLSYSDDEGITWSDPKTVNDDNSQRHQFFTWMTVDPTDGNIYIVFYDRRNTLDNATDVYLAASDDGGMTFKNIKISENSFIPKSNVFFGDYINIDAYDGNIHPIWVRMDNGINSIWTAKITKEQIWNNTSVEEKNEIVKSFKLHQNYPNPFNPETIIEYEIPEESYVCIKVFDPNGKEIKTLFDGYKSQGRHQINFDGSNLASGVYFYKMVTEKSQIVKKMALMK